MCSLITEQRNTSHPINLIPNEAFNHVPEALELITFLGAHTDPEKAQLQSLLRSSVR